MFVSDDKSHNVSNGNTNIIARVGVNESLFSADSVSSSETDQWGSGIKEGSTLSTCSQSDQVGTSEMSSQVEQINRVSIEQVELRRSWRVRRPTDRYGDCLSNQQTSISLTPWQLLCITVIFEYRLFTLLCRGECHILVHSDVSFSALFVYDSYTCPYAFHEFLKNAQNNDTLCISYVILSYDIKWLGTVFSVWFYNRNIDDDR